MANLNISQQQTDSLVSSGVNLINVVSGAITQILSKAVELFKTDPLLLIGGLVVLGMVNNSQGGIKLGKAFEIKM